MSHIFNGITIQIELLINIPWLSRRQKLISNGYAEDIQRHKHPG